MLCSLHPIASTSPHRRCDVGLEDEVKKWSEVRGFV